MINNTAFLIVFPHCVNIVIHVRLLAQILTCSMLLVITIIIIKKYKLGVWGLDTREAILRTENETDGDSEMNEQGTEVTDLAALGDLMTCWQIIGNNCHDHHFNPEGYEFLRIERYDQYFAELTRTHRNCDNMGGEQIQGGAGSVPAG